MSVPGRTAAPVGATALPLPSTAPGRGPEPLTVIAARRTAVAGVRISLKNASRASLRPSGDQRALLATSSRGA